jgi:DNA-binding transcriptional ArsR family regulator
LSSLTVMLRNYNKLSQLDREKCYFALDDAQLDLEDGVECLATDFTATIWPHAPFAGLRLPLSSQSGSVNGGVADLGGNVARRRQAVLDELTRAGGLSARELSERLKVGSRTLERDLSALIEAGLVLREGSPKISFYRPSKTEYRAGRQAGGSVVWSLAGPRKRGGERVYLSWMCPGAPPSMSWMRSEGAQKGRSPLKSPVVTGD